MDAHISIDCETGGKGPNALLFSVAAVAFDPLTGAALGEYHALIHHPEGFEVGAIDLSTMLFWLRQSDEARAALFAPDLPRVSLDKALRGLFDFVKGWRGRVFWQRGDKDREWLKASAAACGLELPWEYWQVRDVRTLAKVVGVVPAPAYDGPKHSALTDAYQQAAHVAAILSRLDAAGLLLDSPCGKFKML